MFLKAKLVRHHDINRPLTSLILLQDGTPVPHQLISRVLVATKWSVVHRGIPVHVFHVDGIAQGRSTMRCESDVLVRDEFRHMEVVLDSGLRHHVQQPTRSTGQVSPIVAPSRNTAST